MPSLVSPGWEIPSVLSVGSLEVYYEHNHTHGANDMTFSCPSGGNLLVKVDASSTSGIAIQVDGNKYDLDAGADMSLPAISSTVVVYNRAAGFSRIYLVSWL